MKISIKNNKTAKEGIIAIGQELIKRAENITTDLKDVGYITIYAQLNPTEIVNFDVTKNYIANFEEKDAK